MIGPGRRSIDGMCVSFVGVSDIQAVLMAPSENDMMSVASHGRVPSCCLTGFLNM